jgi:hypothetical protein
LQIGSTGRTEVGTRRQPKRGIRSAPAGLFADDGGNSGIRVYVFPVSQMVDCQRPGDSST